MKYILLALVIVGSLAGTTHPTLAFAAQSGCGLKPLKPLTPLGCKGLVAECRCDSKGKNCTWEWVCVPR